MCNDTIIELIKYKKDNKFTQWKQFRGADITGLLSHSQEDPLTLIANLLVEDHGHHHGCNLKSGDAQSHRCDNHSVLL